MKRGVLLACAVVLPRLLVFPLNENLGGDAIVRTWLAHRWLLDPHLITGFDGGGFQFGPLQLYVLALAEAVWPSLLNAGRVTSLLFGCLTAWPLLDFTRRRFGERAADYALVVFGLWGLHVQCSTTASSEALNLLLVMTAIAAFDRGSTRALCLTALCLNLACATRYDAWLLVPMVALAEWWRTRRFARGLLVGAASSIFAVLWMIGNFVDRGDPLFPFHFIDAFHRAWWPSEAAHWGEGAYRVMCALFWPGSAVAAFTPLVAFGSFVSLWRLWRTQTSARWLLPVIVVPWLLYGVRGALFGAFAPLARFTVKELLLLIPLAGWWLSSLKTPLRSATLALLGGWTAFLALFCLDPSSASQRALRPIAPTSRIDRSLRLQASALSGRWTGGLAVFDEDPRDYDDLVLSYFSGLPSEAQLRHRAKAYSATIAGQHPEWLVLFEGGPMVARHEVEPLTERRVRFRGEEYERVTDGRASLYWRLTPRP